MQRILTDQFLEWGFDVRIVLLGFESLHLWRLPLKDIQA